jgi:CDP-glycerol glycerophosphotransferase (TagB/SpsB family)
MLKSNIKQFKNQKILIAPYSPLTTKLAFYLENNLNVEIVGFVDAVKAGNKIYKKENIKSLTFDNVLIFSPNHFRDIYNTLKKYVSIKNLYKVDIENNEYIAYNFWQVMYQNIKTMFLNMYNKSKKLFLKYLSLFLDKINFKRDLAVFIAEDFIDANIKHLFIYYVKNNKKAVLLTNNNDELKELKKNQLKTAQLFSWEGYFYTALAKIIYLDHFILDYLNYTSPMQTTVQLWHGVGLKPIRDRSNFYYNYFISTSNWTNETNFKKVFKADKFLNFGYPRNDILLKEREDKLDLLLCDKKIYENIKNNRKQGIKNILYMPTFRENGFDKFPLNFKILNNVMKKLNVMFYVKLHPFVLNKYRDSIKKEEYENIIFYNTQGDIYPILKYIDILITDYSSVAYDFLFLDRPIIFFNYDYDKYIKTRENDIGKNFLFDYYEYTPGKKVQTQNDLINEIENLLNNKDLFEYEREEVKQKFFDYIDGNSCKRIINITKV